MTCLRGIELRIIVFIFLLIPRCSGTFCSRQNRETNSIGTACTELEHCVSKFDPQTGDCPGNQCEPGWMGPGCQYVNLAFHPGITNDVVFDGNMSTHRITEDGKARIIFDGTYNVSALRFITVNRNYSGTLNVMDSQYRPLYNNGFPSSSPTIFLTNPTLTNELHMSFDSSLDIAEIEVFGGKNVALWKYTNQSTTYSEGVLSFTSDKAVDGNGDGTWSSHTCTHTQLNSDNPTWNVYLGNAYYIIAIKIKNRNDNQNRINGFNLYGTAENKSVLSIYNDTSPTQNRDEIFIDSSHMLDVPIKVITIKGPNTDQRILTLCEVFVYASIKNKHGNFCPERCQRNSICRTDNLVCHTCQDGWGGPYCHRITCQRPNVTSPLKIATDPNKQTFDYYETIEFRCPEGYNMNGTAVQHCTQNGILQQNLPTCLRITCQRPNVTPPLKIATDPNKQTFDYYETIEFRCPEGYNMNGKAVQHCTQNGILQQNLPTCLRITCQRPNVTPPLKIATDPNKQTFDYYETIEFRCPEGYNMNGKAVQHCTQNGILQQNLPTCLRITCRRPNVTPPLQIATDANKQTFNFSEVIRFRCAEGYNLIGATVQHCTQNGILQQNLPTCSPITCQQPFSWNTPNLSTNQTTYKYNETIRFLCSEGFYLQGNQEKKCIRNGTIEPPFPNCTAITCQQPVSWNITHILANGKTYRYNETIRFLCSEGFYLQENKERKCTKRRPLEPPFPNSITCQPPVSSEAPHILTDKETYSYNETIQFSCSEGFFLQTNQERNCTKNGPLKPPYPNCKEVRCITPAFEQKEIIILPNVTDHKYNKTIQFECKQGFSLKGSQKATCHQNASFWFIDGTPKCEGVICRTPAFEQKEIIILPNVTDHKYNKTIQFECKQGFSLKGSQKATCHQNASFWFIDGTPKCEEVRCRTPTLQQKDVMIKPNKTSHKYNTTVQFECKQGFSLKGPQQATCQQNASFLFIGGTQPECEVSEEDNSLSEAVVAGVSVGSLAAIAAVVVVVIIVLRKRRSKKPDSKYYKNDALSLDDIDHQYAEVNANRTKKNKGASKQEEASNEQKTTYYNMNSHDVDKAKQARQEVYYEFSPVCRPSETAIPVTEFKNYVEIKKGNQEFFAEQFKKFYTGLQFPATAAVAPGNKSKNKYKNIYPYDETRVLLKVEKGSSDSDFINASFIHGFGNVKSYIAAQGPLINTIDDFWWMVWNEKSDKIVMLTNLSEDDKVKCIQYWPDSDSMDTRNMKLELVVSESFADFTIRTFNLINGKESRTIRQFHFTAWPDKGVPAYASSLVHFHSKVIHTPGTLKGPMVVHCSAGIGRTGTFIALNYLVQQAKESGYVDVFECVETLRRQRLNMVQTLEQYKFLHNATLEALMCTSSDPSASKFPQIYEDLFKVDAETGKRNIDLNFENLNVALSTLPESAYSLAKNSTNRKKNRYSNILPVDSEMPEIWDEENNPIYINAVFLPAYKSKRSFIATQMPLKDTVVDFWRLLYEQQVSTIVMLNQLDSDKPKENIGKYWPKDLNAVSEFGPFRITKKGLTEGKDFTIIDLCCHKEGQNEDESKLRLFQCHFWPDSSTVPTSVLAFLKLINDVELHHDRNNSGPLVVHCMNGAEKSGLFCVMQVVLERMKIEQDVAIHHVIQQMRSIRPSIIPNVEQFKFCHDVVLEFLKQFDDYSNFQ